MFRLWYKQNEPEVIDALSLKACIQTFVASRISMSERQEVGVSLYCNVVLDER